MNVLAASISPDDPPMAVSARRLTRIYAVGSVQVTGIDGIDLSIPNGQMVVLKGDSGSGKSTLLSLLAGLDQLSSGELTVAGHDLNHCSEADLTDFRRNVVGMIFQAFNLLPTLTVLENVCLPAMLAGRPIKRSGRKRGNCSAGSALGIASATSRASSPVEKCSVPPLPGP
jgi:ABC-type lipoprotein export system ATPase subunit